MIRLTTEEFIQKAKLIHAEKYDYSKVEYINKRTKICIVCPIHGEFWQLPDTHTSAKSGCIKCGFNSTAKSKIKPFSLFIGKANEIHKNIYKYIEYTYKGFSSKMKIECSVHGVFEQTPTCHIIQKQGCPKCYNEKTSKRLTLYLDEVINRANKKHNNKYDYSKFKYISTKDKSCIICPVHGEFWQNVGNHLNGSKCPQCAISENASHNTLSTEKFIQDAKLIHGDKYDYSKVDYKKAIEKVCIICPKHGEFWQTPNCHKSKQGCPICNQSKMEIYINKILLKNNINFEYQKRFDWLGKQSLDFFLPDYNVAIECQGEQHFKICTFFGGEKGFEKTKKRDSKKNRLCLKHNIIILYYHKQKGITAKNHFINKEKLLDRIKKGEN